MQCRVGLVDLVTSCDAIRPNVAELIEAIDPSAGDENEIIDVCRRLQKSANLCGEIADKRRTEQNERPLLA